MLDGDQVVCVCVFGPKETVVLGQKDGYLCKVVDHSREARSLPQPLVTDKNESVPFQRESFV